MTASYITLPYGSRVATESFMQEGVAVHLQKFMATNPAGLANAYGAGGADATTPRFTLANDDAGVAAIVAAISGAPNYEVIAASDTDEVAGGAGAVGDVLYQLLVIPLTTSPGEVSIEDGATNTVVFLGGADSVATLIPFTIDLGGIQSTSSGWKITTGANVRVVAIGRFT